MQDQPSNAALKNVLAETILDVRDCTSEQCHNFRLVRTPLRPGEWFMLYSKVYWTADDRADLQPRWICFDRAGNRTDCDPTFPSVAEKNRLFTSFAEVGQWPTIDMLQAVLKNL